MKLSFESFKEKYPLGAVTEGSVRSVQRYGIIVAISGIRGLVHISDISWERPQNQLKMFSVGQKVNVVILKHIDNEKHVKLGIKQLSPHPWEALEASLQVGDKVKGRVVAIKKYGVFIEVASGVHGLMHVSEMSWDSINRWKSVESSSLHIGDEVEVVIIKVHREQRKLSFSLKQLIPNPWIDIRNRYPVGSKHTGTVKSFKNFGVFVELEEYITGLVHINDLSWNKKIKHPSDFTSLEAGLDVQVLEINENKQRLYLGHKQLKENPWDEYETAFTVGTEHEATVTQMNNKGGVVILPYGVEGFCPKRHLTKEDGATGRVDETLNFQVIEFNKELQRIVLSHALTYKNKSNEPLG